VDEKYCILMFTNAYLKWHITHFRVTCVYRKSERIKDEKKESI